MTAPATLYGKQKVYEETYKSAFERSSEREALESLRAIRESHDAAHGWVEIQAYAEPLPNGRWRAVRHHAQYK